jgi:hypothetical protein
MALLHQSLLLTLEAYSMNKCVVIGADTVTGTVAVEPNWSSAMSRKHKLPHRGAIAQREEEAEGKARMVFDFLQSWLAWGDSIPEIRIATDFEDISWRHCEHNSGKHIFTQVFFAARLLPMRLTPITTAATLALEPRRIALAFSTAITLTLALCLPLALPLATPSQSRHPITTPGIKPLQW